MHKSGRFVPGNTPRHQANGTVTTQDIYRHGQSIGEEVLFALGASNNKKGSGGKTKKGTRRASAAAP